MAHKQSRTTGLHVRIEPHHSVTRWVRQGAHDTRYDAEAAALRDWAKEFMGFLRDHRSQDVVGIEVVEEKSDVCSDCGRAWKPCAVDTDEKEFPPYCAWCGADVTTVDNAGRESRNSNEVGK